jgi:hypothetical protein
MSDKPATVDDGLTRQDYNDLWYLVDYHGSKMWPPEKAKRLLSLIKNAEKASAE